MVEWAEKGDNLMDESNIIVILQIIVSLLAGVVGAILALVGQHLVSKRTTETEMKKTVLATFLPTRLKAYTDYISALKTWSEVRDDSSCAGMYHAANAATLVASEETIQNLSAVQQFIIAYQETGEMPHEQEFGKAKLSLIIAMNKDLMHYHAPAISLDIQ